MMALATSTVYLASLSENIGVLQRLAVSVVPTLSFSKWD